MHALPIRLLLALALLAWLPAPAAAGGWTQPRDDYYLKVWARGLFGSKAYDADGAAVSIEPFRDVQLNYYGEYGLTDRWTVVAFGTPTAYARVVRGTFYVGPMGLGVRRALSTGPWKIAAEAQYGLESGIGRRDLRVTADRPSGEIAYFPSVHNHRGELQLQLGKALPFGWLSLTAGARLNSGVGIDHALLGDAQLGYQASARLQLRINLQTYQPLGSVRRVNASGVGQTRYLGFGLSLSYRFGDGIAAVAGVDGGLARSNAGALPLQLGVELP